VNFFAKNRKLNTGVQQKRALRLQFIPESSNPYSSSNPVQQYRLPAVSHAAVKKHP